MKLTSEQKEAIKYEGHLCLVSCPGSGKTRTIIGRILRDVEKVRDSSRRVLCITYTNAAVYEIESRIAESGLGQDLSHCEVCTIHSFCLNHILRPFSHLITGLKSDWEITTPDDEWFRSTIAQLAEKHSVPAWAMEGFEGIVRQHPNTILPPKDIPLGFASEFCQLCASAGKLTFNDIVYFSACLIIERPFIARGLGSRFSSILIDEFQDTTFSQIEILKRICAGGVSTVFYVGDPNQSILGFAGASETQMTDFAVATGASAHVSLSGNFRCSRNIVRVAERLCPSVPEMEAVGQHKDSPIVPRHIHCTNAADGILNYFLPVIEQQSIPLNECAILAPWWISLFPIGRTLRERQIAVFGPGSRPYKRSHEFSNLAEQLCAFHLDRSPEAAGDLLRALFHCVFNITGEPPWRIYSYAGKCLMFELVQVALAARQHTDSGVKWLRQTAALCSELLRKHELIPSRKASVLCESVEGMILDMTRSKVDLANLSVDDLGLFGNPKKSIQLMTLHRSKGREFDAVAVIDAHEGRIPHFTAKSDAEIREARRLMYVATTRARVILMVITDRSDRRNVPSRFLGPDGMNLQVEVDR